MIKYLLTALLFLSSSAFAVGPIAGGSSFSLAQTAYPVAAENAETTTWAAAVTTASGTITTAERAAVDTFVTDLKVIGISKFLWVNPRTGDYAASKVPVIKAFGANETHTGFGSGDYSRTVGLTGGTNKYLDTGLTPSTATGLAAGSVCAFAALTNATVDTYKAAFFTTDGTNVLALYPYYASGITVKAFASGGPQTFVSSNTGGLVVVSRTSTTDLRAYRNGVQAGSVYTTTSAATPPTTHVYMFRDPAGTQANSDHSITLSGLATGLTPADVANLNIARINLDSALNR